ncbi:hypothetical protein [Lyngbya sp. PCC 8106]|uniref:hypothetical protein n=1 Tax=Lyngbya sp. (strain PCC 8106) TaxID=313612 RepID=UPI0012E9B7EF|nr:hypothetical protein [Lyngbya sp. PCC 8106]
MTAKFSPGFRLSVIDTGFTICIALLIFRLWSVNERLSLMILGSAIQFFLFCNVFRVSRIPELIWAFLYVLICLVGLMYELSIVFWGTAGLLIGIVIIMIECKRPSYHGILWKKINPNLEQWFKNNIAK